MCGVVGVMCSEVGRDYMASGVKGCLLARKVMCCVEKVCKGSGNT